MMDSKFIVVSGLGLGSGKSSCYFDMIEHILNPLSWFGENDQDLKKRLSTAIQNKDYLMIKSCLIELRAILSELFGPIRFSLILLCLLQLIGHSLLAKYKANLDIPSTARQGEKIESFPPHIRIYA
ncbi:hypothetical protein RG677_004831 [Vibrio parahaemolyticus]|uniref:Uncharacterized protein n=1 Tax=Vibrio parahaemolyticus TaxID=670 RepID=A0A7Z2MR57_VIBPH|nr:hypothetical protein [Vibrio parahaemolyticus]MBY8139557.1 hypothetical protein [Vibrio fluvialis]EGR0771651.1 hypothetical protein [Vibrio parahaemolyticus]EGR0841555.1 hypothetical protein [Vibrio parahaemolyticus]EHK0753634.1 hypothetical protein [Vibrio parahaemolyticus]EHR6735437.1 hypothetical protein [Vibrio parahaemolyticus]